MVVFNTEYYTTLDRGYYSKDAMIDAKEKGIYTDFPEYKEQITNLTGLDIGSSEADIGGGTPLQKIQAGIRSGSAKIEFTFFGSGKSGGQQHTPESVGRLERQQLQELAKLNQIKLTTHVTPNGVMGVAGMSREGFEEQKRAEALREINKAIEFAAEATTGGAVVFHTGEWQRPLTDVRGNFKSYSDEDKTAPVLVVDKITGDIQGFKRDQSVFEPQFLTAEDWEKEKGIKIVGKKDKYGFIVEKNDWVDIDGNAIKKEWLLDPKNTERLFDRVPKWNKEKTNFYVEEKKFEDYVRESEELKKRGINITPEVLFMKSQIANSVLEAKGASLYHAQRYEELKKERDALMENLKFVEKLEKSTPPEERWKLLEYIPKGVTRELGAKYSTREEKMPSEIIKEQIKDLTNQMRHIHEASSSYDARAQQALERMNRITTLEDYGLNKSTETIAQAAINAMYYSEKNKKNIQEPIYVAPESWLPQMYGSHPDEIRTLIQKSREEMAKMLMQKGYSKEEAMEKAKTHIKATIDTGHFNQWRKYWQAKPGEDPEKAEKRFEKWYLDEVEKLAKEGIIGHVHLTDNFGYDDEHLTPGQGNVPMKEFIKRMEKAGIKDFIVERGSDNPYALHDTLAEFGSPIHALSTRGRRFNFSNLRQGHFGYAAPANYIVGAYAPSNEWKLWSEVPLE
ncbi:MAG: TIM barrel protein [Candidatus Woesearchaeota archaeon]